MLGVIINYIYKTLNDFRGIWINYRRKLKSITGCPSQNSYPENLYKRLR